MKNPITIREFSNTTGIDMSFINSAMRANEIKTIDGLGLIDLDSQWLAYFYNAPIESFTSLQVSRYAAAFDRYKAHRAQTDIQ